MVSKKSIAALAAACLVSSPGTATAATIEGNAGNNTLWGTSRSDSIFGYDGDDKLYGRGGEDRLSGGPGADYLKPGDSWDDLALGGAGWDTLVGDANGTRRVRLYGGAGNDRIWVGFQDVAKGEGGADRIVNQAVDTATIATVYGGYGNDWIAVWGAHVYPGPGRDSGNLRGGSVWADDDEVDHFVCDGHGESETLWVESRDPRDSFEGRNGCRIDLG